MTNNVQKKDERIYELVRAAITAQWRLSTIVLDSKDDSIMYEAQAALEVLSKALMPYLEQ